MEANEAAGAVPLGTEEAQTAAEIRLGLRCAQCGGPITDPGVGDAAATEYLIFEPGFQEGQPGVAIHKVILCGGDDCAEARAEAEEAATAKRGFRAWERL